MFTLLLVTDKPETRALYAAYEDWEHQDFCRPTIVQTAAEAIEVLRTNRYDAISCLLPLEEGKLLFEHLGSQDVVGMDVARDPDRLRREIGNVRRALLAKEREQQLGDEEDMTLLLQHDFLCELLQGKPFQRSEIDRMTAYFRGRVKPECPVIAASFRLPEGDHFAKERWKYGDERLGHSLRNVFEDPQTQLHFVLKLINAHHVRLLGYATASCTEGTAYTAMLKQVAKIRKSLEQVFDMPLVLKWIMPFSSLYDLAEHNVAKTAQ